MPFSHLSHLDGVHAFPLLLSSSVQQRFSIREGRRKKSLILPFSPIYFIIKAVVDFPGKLSLEHRRTRTHFKQNLPVVPSSSLHFGVHYCCYEYIFWGVRGREMRFYFVGIPSHPLQCWGGRVLIAFCHATQHSVIQAKNFG